MNTNNTGETGGIGTKAKGVAQVVHGFGENFRGTVLGAIDSATDKKSENEEIARKGKAEMEEGMTKIKGRKAGGGQTGGAGASATPNIQGQGRDDKHPTGPSGGPSEGYGNDQDGGAGGAGTTGAGTGQHRSGDAT